MSATVLPEAALDRLGRALLATSSEAIIQSDRDGMIRFWNPGAERLFGFTAAEALGQSLDIIIPAPQRERHWAGYQRVMETGESRYGHGDILAVPGLRRDGSRISLEFTILPLPAAEGMMEGMVAILRDVSQRFEELRQLRREVAGLKSRGDRGPGGNAPPT